MDTGTFQDLSKKSRRRLLLRALLSGTLKVLALGVLYFALPLDRTFSARDILVLIVALIAVIGLVIFQYHAIVRSPYPRLTAAAGLTVTIAVFVLSFASVYYLMERSTASSFTQPMTRLDALYFATTVLTTVGFGDIAARSELARSVTTVQMFADLILIGVVVRVLMNAIGAGLTIRSEGQVSEPPATASGTT